MASIIISFSIAFSNKMIISWSTSISLRYDSSIITYHGYLLSKGIDISLKFFFINSNPKLLLSSNDVRFSWWDELTKLKNSITLFIFLKAKIAEDFFLVPEKL